MTICAKERTEETVIERKGEIWTGRGEGCRQGERSFELRRSNIESPEAHFLFHYLSRFEGENNRAPLIVHRMQDRVGIGAFVP